MTQEDFCSQELYKLLIDKGFEFDCYEPPFTQRLVTHQYAMKWLREKDIDIIIMPLFKLKEGRIYCYEIHSDNTDVRVGRFETYEEAVEAALKYVLENLI